MNSRQNNFSIQEICKNGQILKLLDEYILVCNTPPPQSDEEKQKKQTKPFSQKSVFPNLAGFCRFLKIGLEEFEQTALKFPSVYSQILTVFEDEALNSGMSATLVSAYLKKRLTYEGNQKGSCPSQLQISFEHDIFADGE